MIARRFSALYRQLTLRPDRLMTTSAPSISAVHDPALSPSHGTTRHGAGEDFRLSTTTSSPEAWNERASMVPTCPLPPGITIFMGLPLQVLPMPKPCGNYQRCERGHP